MENVPLGMFVLAGVALAFAAHYVIAFGLPNRLIRGILAAVYYIVSGIAAYLAVVWWQAVIMGKGGLWVLKNYFPSPGLWYTVILLAAQVVVAQIFWRLIIKSADGSEKETRRKTYE